VLQVLQKEGISIDFVAGTSVGAMIGAAYCSGMPIKDILSISEDISWWTIARPHWGYEGLFSFRGISNLFVKEFGDPTFESLTTPFAVVATDIDLDEEVVITEGRIAPAVEASCSIAGVVAPVHLNGKRLADGIYVDAVPISAVQTMGAEYTVGVDVFKPLIRPRWGLVSHALNAVEIVMRHSGGGMDRADCLISPEIAGFTYLRFAKRHELIKLGRQAAEAKIPEIKRGVFN